MHSLAKTSPARAAFTVIELVIGMSITTITLAALGAFTMSVAAAWKANDAQAEAATVANVTSARVGAIMRTARAVGALREGSFTTPANPAAVMVWTADANADGITQLLELEMLGYDPATKRLCRYQPLEIKDDEDLTPAQFNDDELIKRALAEFTPMPIAPRIDAMRLYKSAAGRKAAALEAHIRIRNGEQRQVFTVVSAMRGGVED